MIGTDNCSSLSGLVDFFTNGPTVTKIGAVVFSKEARLVFTLDTYTDAQFIKDAILGLDFLGRSTNIPEGLKVTREQCFNATYGDRPDVQNVAIFISDGVPFPENRRDPAISEAENLKRVATVTAIGIGVTDGIERDLLKTFSSSPQIENQNWFVAVNFVGIELHSKISGRDCM